MDRFTIWYPHCGETQPRSKEEVIEFLKKQIRALEEFDGASIAGTGFAVHCNESDGWSSNYSNDEFMNEVLQCKV